MPPAWSLRPFAATELTVAVVDTPVAKRRNAGHVAVGETVRVGVRSGTTRDSGIGIRVFALAFGIRGV